MYGWDADSPAELSKCPTQRCACLVAEKWYVGCKVGGCLDVMKWPWGEGLKAKDGAGFVGGAKAVPLECDVIHGFHGECIKNKPLLTSCYLHSTKSLP